MAIVTYDYYTDTYLGEAVAESVFPQMEAKAERLVNQITHGRAANYAALPEFQQQAIHTAICAQVEYYSLVGVDVSVNGETVQCHCPTTGRIGNIDLSGRPCLLSPSDNPKRKTRYTVEAISLGRPDDSNKRWIGINQNAANRYVEHYLRHHHNTSNRFYSLIDSNRLGDGQQRVKHPED